MWLFLTSALLTCGVTEEENGAKLFRENSSPGSSEKWVAGGKRGHFQRWVWNVKVVCWNLYLEVEFFGPDFAILVQSCSFQICVLIYWAASRATLHTAVTKENPSSRSICQQGWIKGKVCWLRIPLPLREPGKSVSIWRKRKKSLWLTVSSKSLKKVLLNSESSADDTGLCCCFPACDSLRTSKGKYFLSPVMGAVSLHHASQGWSQTGRFF